MHTSAPSGFVIDPRYAEKQRLFRAVDQFALEMKARLIAKLDLGWQGWEDEDLFPLDEIHRRLLACLAKSPQALGQEADAANFLLFLWQRRRRTPTIAPADPSVDPRPSL